MATDLELDLSEAQRELKTRQRVYPRWIETGALAADTATHRLACQRRIVQRLQALLEEQEGQGVLFGTHGRNAG